MRSVNWHLTMRHSRSRTEEHCFAVRLALVSFSNRRGGHGARRQGTPWDPFVRGRRSRPTCSATYPLAACKGRYPSFDLSSNARGHGPNTKLRVLEGPTIFRSRVEREEPRVRLLHQGVRVHVREQSPPAAPLGLPSGTEGARLASAPEATRDACRRGAGPHLPRNLLPQQCMVQRKPPILISCLEGYLPGVDEDSDNLQQSEVDRPECNGRRPFVSFLFRASGHRPTRNWTTPTEASYPGGEVQRQSPIVIAFLKGTLPPDTRPQRSGQPRRAGTGPPGASGAFRLCLSSAEPARTDSRRTGRTSSTGARDEPNRPASARNPFLPFVYTDSSFPRSLSIPAVSLPLPLALSRSAGSGGSGGDGTATTGSTCRW